MMSYEPLGKKLCVLCGDYFDIWQYSVKKYCHACNHEIGRIRDNLRTKHGTFIQKQASGEKRASIFNA